MSGVTIEVLPTAAIQSRTWDEIWELTREFYDTQRSYAEGRLQQQRETVLFRTRSDQALVGMASVNVAPIIFRGRKLIVIHTSHVLLRERYRGLNLLQQSGFRAFLRTRLRFPLRPIYWFFDTFSYKSYLLLPRNFRDFWPRPDRPTPEPERALINELASHYYGSDWRPEQGIVERSGHKKLRAGTAPLEHSDSTNLNLAFFARANPGHAEGDMLVCLCPLSLPNWISLGMRALRRARRR